MVLFQDNIEVTGGSKDLTVICTHGRDGDDTVGNRPRESKEHRHPGRRSSGASFGSGSPRRSGDAEHVGRERSHGRKYEGGYGSSHTGGKGAGRDGATENSLGIDESARSHETARSLAEHPFFKDALARYTRDAKRKQRKIRKD